MPLPIETIRYLNNGEPHNSEVYNRPIQDLAEMTKETIEETQQNAQAEAIVFAIALGG